MVLRFTCGESKVWKKVKKTQNILTMIVKSYLMIQNILTTSVLKIAPQERIQDSVKHLRTECFAKIAKD